MIDYDILVKVRYTGCGSHDGYLATLYYRDERKGTDIDYFPYQISEGETIVINNIIYELLAKYDSRFWEDRESEEVICYEFIEHIADYEIYNSNLEWLI